MSRGVPLRKLKYDYYYSPCLNWKAIREWPLRHERMWVNPKVTNPSQNGKTDVCSWWPDGKRMGYEVTYSSPNGSPGQGGTRERPNDWLGP